MDIISEQEETDNKMVELMDLLSKIQKDQWFKTDINFNSGSGYIVYDIESNKKPFTIEISLTYFPDHVNPIIPVDLFKVGGDQLIHDICLAKDMSKEELVQYFGDVLNNISVRFTRSIIFLIEGVFHLKDYMDNNIYITKIEGHHSLYDLLTNENLYVLLPEQLPRFADGYTDVMSKLIKKCKTIYTALGKGTWKGHTYDYGKFDQKNIVVHQKIGRYNKRDKILFPDFEITHNQGWAYIDGVKITSNTCPLNDDEKKEFKDWLEAKFKHFGIDFSA